MDFHERYLSTSVTATGNNSLEAVWPDWANFGLLGEFLAIVVSLGSVF
jgi:hypothetical protein